MLRSLFSQTESNLRRVGFWKDGILSPYPNPQDHVDWTWSADERREVTEYLRSGRIISSEFGCASCRMGCDNARPAVFTEMGCHDLSDGVYVWPEGYAHYLEKHGVKPPEEFLQHVRKFFLEPYR